MIQALIPMAAHAAQMGETAVAVCAIDGAHTVHVEHVPSPHKGFAGLPCADCLTAAIAVVLNAPSGAVSGPVAFVQVEHDVRPLVRLPFARAPPRPPGQGPPTFDA